MKQFEGMMMVGEVILVPDMHTRKRLMNEKADGFIALPGGFGTFEELLEIVTWAQLNIHRKPIGVLNVADYFTPLIALLETGVREGFIQPANMELIIFRSDPAELLRAMQAYRTPEGAGYNLSWGDAKGLS
ncbi:hypothetical protein HK104_001339 [Borealophlyctis nickersoniae]|nr:hypothetical protein HK104_001339 [Borealophlyctis nickersoniae]